MHNTAAGPRRVVLLLAAAIMVSACSGRLAGSAVAQGDGSILRSQSPPSVLSSAGATVDQFPGQRHVRSRSAVRSRAAVRSHGARLPFGVRGPGNTAHRRLRSADGADGADGAVADLRTFQRRAVRPRLEPTDDTHRTESDRDPDHRGSTTGHLPLRHPVRQHHLPIPDRPDHPVRCDLAESDITEQHDCHGIGDWGHAVVLESGKPAGMQCISDSVMAPACRSWHTEAAPWSATSPAAAARPECTVRTPPGTHSTCPALPTEFADHLVPGCHPAGDGGSRPGSRVSSSRSMAASRFSRSAICAVAASIS